MAHVTSRLGATIAPGPAHRGGLTQGAERMLRAILGLADDAGEIAIAHDGDKAGNGTRVILGQSDESGSGEFGSQHAAMQHPGQSEIVNETGMRENLIWNIHPLNRFSGKGALRRGFRRRAWRSVAVQ